MKARVYRFLEAGKTEAALSFLIVASCTAIILESFAEFREAYSGVFLAFEAVVVLIFSLEYALRFWTADLAYPEDGAWRARWRFATSFEGIVDLIAILPFYLPLIVRLDLRFLRILRLTRLLRIFKLYRYTDALQLIGRSFHNRRSELTMALVVTFVLLLFSSTLMYYLEHEAQPDQFPNILASFWWAIATLTTVGYGDVFPITPAGKLVGGVIALLGVGLVALPAGILSASFVEHYEEQRRARKAEKRAAKPKAVKHSLTLGEPCPCCGRKVKGVM